MIYSYSDKDQTVDVNAGLVYNFDEVKTSCTVAHTAGTSVFTLARPGYYYVVVSASGAPSAAGDVQLTLYNGANAISGATALDTSTGTDDIVNLTIPAIIQVRPSCCAVDNTVYLTVINTGSEATFANTAITITKLA